MKTLYTTPEIKFEELTKTDVLCTSGGEPQSPLFSATHNVEDSASGWELSDML